MDPARKKQIALAFVAIVVVAACLYASYEYVKESLVPRYVKLQTGIDQRDEEIRKLRSNLGQCSSSVDALRRQLALARKKIKASGGRAAKAVVDHQALRTGATFRVDDLRIVVVLAAVTPTSPPKAIIQVNFILCKQL